MTQPNPWGWDHEEMENAAEAGRMAEDTPVQYEIFLGSELEHTDWRTVQRTIWFTAVNFVVHPYEQATRPCRRWQGSWF